MAGADNNRGVYGSFDGYATPTIEASAGSAARFFYCAKTSASDRHEGLDAPGRQFTHGSTLRDAEKLRTEWATGRTAQARAGPPNRQEAIEQRNRAVGEEWLAEQGAPG